MSPFADPTPKLGDENNVLLSKICQVLNDAGSGDHPPEPGDSDNNLLFKICLLVNEP